MEELLQLVLLAYSPMASIDVDELDATRDDYRQKLEETSSLNAEYQANFIIETFQYYDVNPDAWIKVQIPDNTAVNKKTVCLLKKPCNLCQNHLLQSETELMMKNDDNLRYIIDTAHGTILECKSMIKNRAVLRNLTKRKLIIYNATRQTGKVDMLSQYRIIYDDLETALEHEDTTFTMNNSINYIISHIAQEVRIKEERRDTFQILILTNIGLFEMYKNRIILLTFLEY